MVRVEEVETPQLLDAWVKTLDLIEALNPAQIIPGHLEQGWQLDAKADLEHNRKYLQLFGQKVTHATSKPQVDDLFETFKQAFPQVGQSHAGDATVRHHEIDRKSRPTRTSTSSWAISQTRTVKAAKFGKASHAPLLNLFKAGICPNIDLQKTAITTSAQGLKSSWRRITLLPESESTMARIKLSEHELNKSPMCPIPVDRRPPKRGFETDTSPDFWASFAQCNDSLLLEKNAYFNKFGYLS
jgi:hypothetical protein